MSSYIRPQDLEDDMRRDPSQASYGFNLPERLSVRAGRRREGKRKSLLARKLTPEKVDEALTAAQVDDERKVIIMNILFRPPSIKKGDAWKNPDRIVLCGGLDEVPVPVAPHRYDGPMRASKEKGVIETTVH